jgi:hypothetical protein
MTPVKSADFSANNQPAGVLPETPLCDNPANEICQEQTQKTRT